MRSNVNQKQIAKTPEILFRTIRAAAAAMAREGIPFEIHLPADDGGVEVLGGIKQEGEKKRTRVVKHPRGEMRDYIMPHLRDLQIGDVATIPLGPYATEELRGAVTSHAHLLWGKGSYTSHSTEYNIELMRLS